MVNVARVLLGLATVGGAFLLIQRAMASWRNELTVSMVGLDPNNRVEVLPNGNLEFRPALGTAGSPRVWFRGDVVGSRTVQIWVKNLGPNVLSIEANASYGYSYVLNAGKEATITSSRTAFNQNLGRRISPEETQGEPFARVNNTSINLWLNGATAEVKARFLN